MAFNWEEYLVLARNLCGQDCTVTREAMLRAAVSRAYYAAFCYARRYAVERMGFHSSDNPDEHSRVICHFEKQGKRAGVATRLREMRLWRNECDYKDNIVVSDQFAMTAIESAQKVIDMLKV